MIIVIAVSAVACIIIIIIVIGVICVACICVRYEPKRKPCSGMESARCCCKIRCISKFTAVSMGSPCDSTAFLF